MWLNAWTCPGADEASERSLWSRKRGGGGGVFLSARLMMTSGLESGRPSIMKVSISHAGVTRLRVGIDVHSAWAEVQFALVSTPAIAVIIAFTIQFKLREKKKKQTLSCLVGLWERARAKVQKSDIILLLSDETQYSQCVCTGPALIGSQTLH